MREREGEGEETGASEREKVWVSLCVSVPARVRELPAPVSSLPAHGVMSHVQGSRWPCALWAPPHVVVRGSGRKVRGGKGAVTRGETSSHGKVGEDLSLHDELDCVCAYTSALYIHCHTQHCFTVIGLTGPPQRRCHAGENRNCPYQT